MCGTGAGSVPCVGVGVAWTEARCSGYARSAPRRAPAPGGRRDRLLGRHRETPFEKDAKKHDLTAPLSGRFDRSCCYRDYHAVRRPQSIRTIGGPISRADGRSRRSPSCRHGKQYFPSPFRISAPVPTNCSSTSLTASDIFGEPSLTTLLRTKMISCAVNGSLNRGRNARRKVLTFSCHVRP